MARKKSGTEGAPPAKADGAASARALDEALDALYAAPLDGFVGARREAVLRLRAAGDVAAARSIATAAKPSRTAWALNQVARSKPALVDQVAKAREAAAAAQKAGDAHAIREKARSFRDAIGEVVQAARAVLEEAGVPLNAAQARRVAETLQALAADDVEREQLIAGRLTQDVEVEDPFAGLEPGPARPRPEASPGAAHPHGRTTSAEAAHPVAHPHGRTTSAEAAHPVAHPHGRTTPKEAHAPPSRADAAALRTQRAKEEAERKREAEERAAREKQRAIDDARSQLAAAERAAESARGTAEVAERALVRAREEANVARHALTKAEGDVEHARARAKKLGA